MYLDIVDVFDFSLLDRIARHVLNKLIKQKGEKQNYGASGEALREGHTAFVILVRSIVNIPWTFGFGFPDYPVFLISSHQTRCTHRCRGSDNILFSYFLRYPALCNTIAGLSFYLLHISTALQLLKLTYKCVEKSFIMYIYSICCWFYFSGKDIFINSKKVSVILVATKGVVGLVTARSL